MKFFSALGCMRSMIAMLCLTATVSQAADTLDANTTVESRGRGIVLNEVSYPDAALLLPISFVRSPRYRFGVFANYVNRVRNRNNDYGCQPDCSDAEISLDIALYNDGRQSFSLLPGIQSLTSRNNGTTLGQGGFLGFRYAFQINETLGFSAGGESIIRLDDTVDLGRNAFVGISKAHTLSNQKGHVVGNIGLGSGIFSLYRDPWIENSFNSDRPAKRSNPDNFDFGPVGSVAYYASESLSLGIEYSGYGLGAGASFKPLKKFDLFATFYIYDFVELSNGPNFDETPNLFGNLTFSF